MNLNLGVNFSVPRDMAQQLVKCAAALASLPSWTPRLRHKSTIDVPMTGRRNRPGIVKTSDLSAEITRLGSDPSVLAFEIRSAAAYSFPESFLWISVNVGDVERLILRALTSYTVPAQAESWFAAFRGLASECGLLAGIAMVGEEEGVHQDVTLGQWIRNGVNKHPDPDQISRMCRKADHLGTRYAFFPRWGTWISHAHLDAIGGPAAIRTLVAPAQIEDTGSAWYVQMSSLEDAETPATLEKIRTMTHLMEPLLPPPIPDHLK